MNNTTNKIALAIAALVGFSATAQAAGGMAVAREGDKKLTMETEAFINMGSWSQSDTPVTATNAAHAQGLAVDRFYMTAKYKLDDVWSARFTADVNNEQAASGSTMQRKMNVFVKYAYIEAAFNDAVQARLGISHTPWIDYEQKLWRHRYVSKVTSDHFKFDDSSDAGFGLKGSFGEGMVSYWATLTNGGGYGNPGSQTQGNNALDFNSRLTFSPIEGLDLSAQYRSGYRGSKVDLTNAAAAPGTKEVLEQVLLSYGTENFRLGANYLTRKATPAVGSSATDTTNALWGWARFGDFGGFAKLESNKLKKQGNAVVEKRTHSVAGLEYFPREDVTTSLAYDNEKFTDRGNVARQTRKVTRVGLFTEFKL